MSAALPRQHAADAPAGSTLERGGTVTAPPPNERAPRAYRLGRLSLTLSGAGECARYLESELASLLDAGPRHADARIAFEIVPELPRLAGYTATPPVWAMENAFRVEYNDVAYHVSALGADGDAGRANQAGIADGAPAQAGRNALLGAGALRVAVRRDDNGRRYRWFSPYYRARDWTFLSGEEIRAKNFMYGVFDYLTQIAQLELGQSYVHASSVERDGGGTAIVAWGGLGKTSAALKLITEHGFRFLSDDLGLVDDSGTLWRTPKRLQVYAYNLVGEERLRSMLLEGRSMLDRAAWAWKLRRRGPKGVRRRVSAEQLFGAASVGERAPLRRVFCLERGDVRDFEAREISADELARRAAEVVMQEIEPFGLVSRALHSGHRAPLLPTQDAVIAATRSVLRRAFDGIPILNVRIPSAASPAALAAYLVRAIER
jgi:hypothetical protein